MTPGPTTLAQGSDSGITSARRSVVRDDASWRALWAAHAGPGSDAPAIDFRSRLVAAVFAGERPSSGHSIAITGARADAGVLTMKVAEQVPPRGQVGAQILVSPFHIVTFARFDGEVRFEDAGSPDTAVAGAARPAPAVAGRNPNVLDSTASSSTGLEPNFAAALAYLAGPFSGSWFCSSSARAVTCGSTPGRRCSVWGRWRSLPRRRCSRRF